VPSLRQILEAFRQQIALELELENVRQEVALRSDFNLGVLWRHMDSRRCGWVSWQDFRAVARDFGVCPGACDIEAVVNRYSKLQDGRIRYADLCDAFLPRDPRFKELLLARSLSRPLDPSLVCVAATVDDLTRTTRWHVARLFSNLVEVERQAEDLKRSFIGYDMHKAFICLDKNSDGFLSPAEICCAFREDCERVTEPEIQALMNRYDKYGDGRISYVQFVYEFRF